MKNFISKVFMAIVACLFCMQTVLAAAPWEYPKSKPEGKFGGGDGTKNSPYLINNAQQLADLAWWVNHGQIFEYKYFKLTADIALNDITWGDDNKPTNFETLKKWTPIGKYGTFVDDVFKGTFDGDNHTVSGLVCEADHYTGLFGTISMAVVRNLNIKDSYIYNGRYEYLDEPGLACGFLIGYSGPAQITNCHVINSNIDMMSIKTWDGDNKISVGGLVGQGGIAGGIAISSKDLRVLSSCSFSGNISLDEMYKNKIFVAGLMGLGTSTMTNCRADGTVNATFHSSGVKSELTLAGLCYEAHDITGSTSGMNFNLKSADDEDIADYDSQPLWLYSMCYQADNISKSATLGTITVAENRERGWNADLGNVKKATSITDCAFYTIVEGKFEKRDSYDNKMTFYPLGSTKQGDIGKIKRVTLLNGDYDYFYTADKNLLSRAEVVRPKVCENFYESDINGLKDDATVLASLNSGDKSTAVWGMWKIDGHFYGFPLPMDCGGQPHTIEFKGEGTETSPYLIGSEWDLQSLSTGINGGTFDTRGKYFALASNLDMGRFSGSKPFQAIGTSDHPFLGTFDGRGYAISDINMENGLFGCLCGTVKNLAVIGASITSKDGTPRGVLVQQLGNSNGLTGSVSGCYVGGDITMKWALDDYNKSAFIGGLCGEAVTGTISDCYFKGRILTDFRDYHNDYYVGGLVGQISGNNFTLKDSYASFESCTSDVNKLHVGGLAGFRPNQTSIAGMGDLRNCYYVCAQATGTSGGGGPASYTDIVTKCDNDSQIFPSYDYTGSSTWVKGAFRPVLRGACCYAATAADGTATTAYFDAIPMTDSNNPSNDIFHFDGTGYDRDKLLWALPNLAVYDRDTKTDYILNCTLAPSKPLNYNKKTGDDVEKVVARMSYPLALTKDQNYYLLCLPGTIDRSDLPKGSRLLIAGKVRGEGEKQYLNVVDADRVDGGVPFIAYIPSSVTADEGTVNIAMASELAMEPQKQIVYDDGKTQEFDLTGTYKEVEETGFHDVTLDADNNPCLAGAWTVQQPFTSYLSCSVTETGPELHDYLMLSETSNETADLLEEYGSNENETRVMVERALRKDAWNTVCLPFDMSADEVAKTFGTGAKVEKLDAVETDAEGGCTLKFTAVTDGMEHGVPYLIKPATVGSIYSLTSRYIYNALSPVAKDVTIDGTEATITLNGTFARKMLGLKDDNGKSTDEYFIQDNKILHVGDGQQIILNGFRAYITASKAAAKALAKARISHSDGTTTALRLVEVGSTADGRQRVYDLQGVEQNDCGARQRGVYIKGGRKYVK